MSTTRSGARLSSHHRGFTYRLAQMSAEDYKQPKCDQCGKPINDDRLEAQGRRPGQFRFCSQVCGTTHAQIRRGIGTGRGQQGRWRSLYDSARAAGGQWITHQCETTDAAKNLSHSIGQRRDFEAVRNGIVVSIRLVVAA